MFQIFKQPLAYWSLAAVAGPMFILLPFGRASLIVVLFALGIMSCGALAAFIESENNPGE